MLKRDWLGKIIGGGKTVISTVEIGLSYKNFVLGILHTSRGHNSTI